MASFNEPLGLPQGTVRAVIALLVIGTALVSLFIGDMGDADKAWLFGLAGVAFGYYFGARQSETAATGRTEPLDQTPPSNLAIPDDATESRIVPGNEIDKEQE